MFLNCTELTSLGGTFSGCTGIDKISGGLFKNCPKITNMQGTFSRSSIKEIPADLFDINNGEPNGITNMIATFSETKIVTIPKGIFDLCTEVTQFGSSGLNTGIFRDCGSLKEIPEGLFKNNTKVTSFHAAFRGCSSIEALPSSLFENCTQAARFSDVFLGCSNLSTIPEGFKLPESATNLNFMFLNCPITSIPNSFVLHDGITSINSTFEGCPIEELPNNFVVPESVTDMEAFLYGCIKLKGSIIINCNPTTYSNCLFYTALSSTENFIVNYTSKCQVINEIIATATGGKVEIGEEVVIDKNE